MKKFDVEITETLQRKVSVEAASQEDAERMVTQAWNNQDYVLDSGDFTCLTCCARKRMIFTAADCRCMCAA